MGEYADVNSIQDVDTFLEEAEAGARAVYWTGVCGPEPEETHWVKLFEHLHQLFHQGKVHLFQERIPRRGFDFILQKR